MVTSAECCGDTLNWKLVNAGGENKVQEPQWHQWSMLFDTNLILPSMCSGSCVGMDTELSHTKHNELLVMARSVSILSLLPTRSVHLLLCIDQRAQPWHVECQQIHGPESSKTASEAVTSEGQESPWSQSIEREKAKISLQWYLNSNIPPCHYYAMLPVFAG